MPDLLTTLNADMPISVCQADNGHLIIANGVQRPRVWDGVGSVYVAGLAKGTATPAIAGSGVGSLSGTYKVYYRFKDNNRLHYSDFSPASTEVTVSGVAQIDYTNIPAADPDTRATHVELWRNTNGQMNVFYLDATLAIGVTTHSSVRTDASLEAQSKLLVTNQDGTHDANRHGLPPAWKQCVAQLNGRTFYAVNAVYDFGHVELTNGSATVQGRNTPFTNDMTGWKFRKRGDSTEYTISAVNVGAQQLTLSTAYAGSTDLFGLYAVYYKDTEKDEELTVYFSEAGLSQSVPQDQNVMELEKDNKSFGRITGLVAHDTYLYIFEEGRLHRHSFIDSPILDGETVLLDQRGAVNHNCIVRVENVFYVLDNQGVYVFGNEGLQPVSLPIQDYFRDKKINWQSRAHFFGVHDPEEEAVKFFVCINGDQFPREALVYRYRWNRWDVESFPVSMASGTLAHTRTGRKAVYGTAYARACAQDQVADLVPSDYTAGTITSSTTYSLVDSAGAFNNVTVGTPVAIVYEAGKAQWRPISRVSGTTIYLNQPLLEKPGTNSKYQIGGIPWKLRLGRYIVPPVNRAVQVAVEVYFLPTKQEAWFDIRRYQNHGANPVVNTIDVSHPLFSIKAQTPDVVVPMKQVLNRDQNPGYGRLDMVRVGGDTRSASIRNVAIELRGFQGPDRIELHRIDLFGLIR